MWNENLNIIRFWTSLHITEHLRHKNLPHPRQALSPDVGLEVGLQVTLPGDLKSPCKVSPPCRCLG